MDEAMKKRLEGILAKDPSQLVPEDIRFLKARRSYLTSEQKRIFSPVLGEFANEPVSADSTAPQETLPESAPASPEPPAPQVEAVPSQPAEQSQQANGGVDPYDPDATPAQG